MNIEHRDRFGELIEEGDIILRSMQGELLEGKVIRMTPKAILINSNYPEWKYDPNSKKWTKIIKSPDTNDLTHRLSIDRYKHWMYDRTNGQYESTENLMGIINYTKLKLNDKSN